MPTRLKVLAVSAFVGFGGRQRCRTANSGEQGQSHDCRFHNGHRHSRG